MKSWFKRIIKKVLCNIYSAEAFVAKKLVTHAYKMLFKATWKIIDPPDNFDHEIDLYYQWGVTQNCFWLERGVYNIQALKMFKQPIVLELCCGDGFNAKYFYASSAKHILACDFDSNIIKVAKKKNSERNIEYITADIRVSILEMVKMVKGEITNIVWDAAIEYFSETETEKIMMDIKNVLGKRGILSGHTVIGINESINNYKFKNKDEMKNFLLCYFKNAVVIETEYKERHNLYFYASQGDIPFQEGWRYWTGSFGDDKDKRKGDLY